MKRVLILCYAFPPDNVVSAMRPVRMANAFSGAGWDVTIMRSSYTGSEQTLNVDGSERRVISYDPTPLSRWLANVPKSTFFVKKFKSMIRRAVFPEHTWLLKEPVLEALGNEIGNSNYDCIVSISFPFSLHMVCLELRRRGCRFFWVADNRDMWLGNPHRGVQIIPTRVIARIEEDVFSNCDVACFASSTTKKIYEHRYRRHNLKTLCILNGHDGEAKYNATSIRKTSGEITFFHAGSLYGGKRDIKPLVRVLERLSRECNLRSRIILAGPDSHAVAAGVATPVGVSIDARGLLPRDEVYRLQSVADFLVTIMQNTRFDDTFTPAKVFEYAFHRRPVIGFASEHSDLSQIINEHDLGVCSFNENRIYEFVVDILTGRRTLSQEVASLSAAHQFGSIVKVVDHALGVQSANAMRL